MKIFPIIYRMGIVFYQQEQGEEFYGPWDGELPAYHTEVYGELFTHCYQLLQPAYRNINDRIICQNFYYNVDEMSKAKRNRRGRGYNPE